MLKSILPKPSAKELVIFSDTAVSYGETEIRYSDAIGLTFHSHHTYGSVNHSNSFVAIRSPYNHIKIKIRSFSFLGLDRSLKNNYEEIYSTAMHHLAKPIADKLVRQITSGSSVQIGSHLFDSTGITSTGLFGSRKRATWNSRPEVRDTNYGIAGLSSVSGIIEIVYHYPPTGKMVCVGRITSRTENGCLVPAIIRAMNQHTCTDVQKPAPSRPADRPAPVSNPSPRTRPERTLKVAACITAIETDLLRRALSDAEEAFVADRCHALIQMALGEHRIILRLIKLELAHTSDITDALRRAEDRWQRDHNRYA